MTAPLSLPGLDHLLGVLKANGVGADPCPPLASAPRAGELVLGKPFDPILAEVYRYFDGGCFGDLILGRFAFIPGYNLEPWEEEREQERIRKLFRFAVIYGFAYYFATAPSLVAPDGRQPVVYLEDYEDQPIWPIASNVDRAFDLYAYYCEARFKENGGLDKLSRGEFVHFPHHFIEHMARDRELVRMFEEGRFDSLLLRDAETRGWVEKLLKIARSSAS